ncbi:MAG: phenylacetic acid degradation protein [Proteobacteria bacterium]|jgi:uncharacterized domain 1|nr:MAG: phenylacetic acid degradation protein [Pseudomonadota bacterium]
MVDTAGSPKRLSKDEVMALVDEHFPQVHEGNGRVTLESLAPMTAQVRMAYDPRSIRPGGTISGPSMFKLADFAVYAIILGELGAAALQAVTTNMTMNFLSRPQPGDMIAHARLIKLGKRLAVAEVELYSDGRPDMVAHATATYALPPAKS